MTALREDKKELEGNISKLVIEFIGKYEPRAVYISVSDKRLFVDKMRELKGSGLAFDYGIITKYPLQDKNECKFFYWDGNVLASALVIVPESIIEIDEYIIYPIPVFNDLVRHIEGHGYLKDLKWEGKPLSVDKF